MQGNTINHSDAHSILSSSQRSETMIDAVVSVQVWRLLSVKGRLGPNWELSYLYNSDFYCISRLILLLSAHGCHKHTHATIISSTSTPALWTHRWTGKGDDWCQSVADLHANRTVSRQSIVDFLAGLRTSLLLWELLLSNVLMKVNDKTSMFSILLNFLTLIIYNLSFLSNWSIQPFN